MYGTVVYQAEY